ASLAGAAMNLVILAGFAAGVLVWLWIAQALALVWDRRRIWVLPFRHGSDSARVRGALKLALGLGLLAGLILYPLAIGENPLRYHGEKFAPVHLGLSIQALCLMTALLSALLAVYMWIGWAKLERRYSIGRIIYKVGKAFLIPIPLTLMEEPLFRGLV